MFAQAFSLALLATAGVVEGRSVFDINHLHGLSDRHAGSLTARQANDATGTTLSANAIQSGSFTDGSVNGVSAAGQSKSATSTNNFINFCSGKTVTNGLQVQGGSCNGIVMGDIPAKANMVSAVITNPKTGVAITANQDFDITVQTTNLVAGSFTNADSTYYSAPQALSGGKVVGHTHVTVQDMGNTLNPTKALDATQFAFFKGINDAGDGNGLLKATVTGGLPAGNYRVCTMTSSSNHQPVLMPVAQRGTPDDCTKFTVGAAGATAGGATGATTGATTGGNAVTGGKASASSSSVPSKASATKATGGKAAASSSSSSVISKASASKVTGGKASSTSEQASAATSKAGKAGAKASSTSEQASSATTSVSNNAGSKASASPVSSAASSKATKAATGTKATTADVGGIAAPGVIDSGDAARPFSVNGNTFVNEAAAIQRNCDVQFNACANASNGGAAFTLADCSTQQTACNAA